MLQSWWAMKSFSPLSLINRNRGVFGLNVGHLWDERRQLQPLMDLILTELSAGRLEPVVAQDVSAGARRRRAPLHPQPLEHRQSRPHYMRGFASNSPRAPRRAPCPAPFAAALAVLLAVDVVQRGLLATALLIGLTCAYTWPLTAYATSAVAHDRGDPLLVTWILWWTSHTVPLTAAWWNAPAFYPSAGVLAFSENLLSLAPDHGADHPCHRLAAPRLQRRVLLSYVFSGAGRVLPGVRADALSRRIVRGRASRSRSRRTACRTRNICSCCRRYWMPVAVAALHLYLASPKWRWAALFAGRVGAAGAGERVLPVLPHGVRRALAGFVVRAAARAAVAADGAPGVAWLAAAGVLAPVFYGYRVDPRGVRIQAKSGGDGQLQRRRRGPDLGVAGLAPLGLAPRAASARSPSNFPVSQ